MATLEINPGGSGNSGRGYGFQPNGLVRYSEVNRRMPEGTQSAEMCFNYTIRLPDDEKTEEGISMFRLKFPFMEGDKFHSFSAFTEKLGVRFCLRFD